MAAVGTTSQITRALQAHLAALTISPAIEVMYFDVKKDKPFVNGVPQPYLEAKVFRAPTETLAVDDDATAMHVGFFQVDVVYPEGKGSIAPTQIADIVKDHFPRGTVLTDGSTKVRIDLDPYVMSQIKDGPYTRTPVSIRFRAFAPQ